MSENPQRAHLSSAQQHGGAAGAKMVLFRVFVAGESCDIAVYARPPHVALAVGEYRGSTVEVGGSTPLSAAAAWANAVRKMAAARADFPAKVR